MTNEEQPPVERALRLLHTSRRTAARARDASGPGLAGVLIEQLSVDINLAYAHLEPLCRASEPATKPEPVNERHPQDTTYRIWLHARDSLIQALYDKGLTVDEICALNWTDVRRERIIQVGGRYCPLDEKEHGALRAMLKARRAPEFLEPALFLSTQSRRIAPRTVRHALRRGV